MSNVNSEIIKIPESQIRPNYQWIVNTRAIASIMVILIHSAMYFKYQLESYSNINWMTINLINSFSRVCVPLFFIISIFLFFQEKKPESRHFIKFTASLLFYSAIYIVLEYFKTGNLNVNAIKNVLYSPVYYHLWFFYYLFFIYIIAVFVNIRCNYMSVSRLVIFGVLIFIIFNPNLKPLLSFFSIEMQPTYILNDFVCYVFLGVFAIYIYKLNIISRQAKYISFAVYLLCTIAAAYMTKIISYQDMQFNETFGLYTSIPIIIATFAIYIFILNLDVKNKYICKFLTCISKNSLAIYGIHVLFIEISIKFVSITSENNPVLKMIAVAIVTLILSTLFSVMLRLIDKKGYVS